MNSRKFEEKLKRKKEFLKGFKIANIQKTVGDVLESKKISSLCEVDPLFKLLREMIEFVYNEELTIDQIDKSEDSIHYKIFVLGEEIADFELVRNKKINREKLEEELLDELSEIPDEVKEMLLNFVDKLKDKLQ